MQKNQVELRSRVSGWPGIGQASLERHHRQWWDDEARGLAWLSTSWRHARLMMSKQAWRFVLKKEQKHDRKSERDRETEGETKRREEKVRGTAQESFSHEAQKQQRKTTKNKRRQSPHTVKKDRAVNTPPLPFTILWRTKKQQHRFKEVTPPRHMAETLTCTNCTFGTHRDPSRASLPPAPPPSAGDLEDGWNGWKRIVNREEEER